jgi:hypothetical protein
MFVFSLLKVGLKCHRGHQYDPKMNSIDEVLVQASYYTECPRRNDQYFGRS